MSHVLVTGGGSGIGAATTRMLAGRGMRVSVLDRTGASGAVWWDGLSKPLRGSWLQTDASDVNALDEAIRSLDDQPLTGLVTCAGVSLKERFLESTLDAWNQTLTLNVIGTAIACRAAARQMVEGGAGGSIVMVSSTAAFGYVAGLGAHYHASKGAIMAMTKALSAELGEHGIRVNAVAPGLVRTPMTEMMRATQGEEGLTKRVPLTRIADPEDVAEAITFLLSADASMITGHVLPVDGGQLAVVGVPLGGFTRADEKAGEAVASSNSQERTIKKW